MKRGWGGWVRGASCLVKAGHKQPVFKCMMGMGGKKSVGGCVEDKEGGHRGGGSKKRETVGGGGGRDCAVRWAVCRGRR